MGPNVTVPHVDDYNFASGLLIFFFNYLFALQFFLVWLENSLFFDFLVKTVLQATRKGGLCIDLNKNPHGKRLFGLLFKIHTQMLQHKAAVKKEATVKR
jgi:hypothetical protein